MVSLCPFGPLAVHGPWNSVMTHFEKPCMNDVLSEKSNKKSFAYLRVVFELTPDVTWKLRLRLPKVGSFRMSEGLQATRREEEHKFITYYLN